MNLLLLPLLFILNLLSIKAQDITIEDPLPSCKGFIISSTTGITQKFGYSVDGNGDINDDAIPDIIVSEYLNSGLSTVYVIYGTKTGYSDINVATMTSQQGFRITGLKLYGSDNTNLVSISGDVDGDGIKDIVIGAAGTDSNKGAVYVIYGKQGGHTDFDLSSSSSLPSDIGFKITSPAAIILGWTINTKVDINGDGIKDIMVTAIQDGSTKSEGAVYVIYGQKVRETDLNIATMPPARGFKISGSAGYYTGSGIGTAGDFNQDYVDDLIMTAPGFSSFTGKAYVVYGKNGSLSSFPLSSMTTTQGFTMTGQSPIKKLALVVSDAGDFNHDGISDIVLSSYDSAAVQGYAVIFYGKKGGPPNLSALSITASAGFKIQGVTTNDQFGSSLSSVQDLNSDGITDLLIGARGYGANKGAVYVIFGRTDQPSKIDLSTFTSDEGFKITGTIVSGALGTSVRSLGDINQDGVPDIIIGAPGAGKAYILFGPNAWACDTCGTSSTCSICKTGYNYKYNGLCYKECPGNAPYKSDFQCFAKCPLYAPYNVSYQCFTGCSGSTPYNFGFQCFSECPKDAPYKSGFQCFSKNPVQPEVVEPISETVKGSVTKGAAATNSANKVLNLWSPADALPFIYGQLKTSIMYMRYLNISRTQKLEEIYQLYYDSDTSVIPFISMSDSMKEAFPMEQLPYMFQKYSLPSSFITNFGDDLMGLLVIFGLLVSTKLAYFLLKRWVRNFSMLKLILHKVSNTLQNFFIGSFGELLGPIIFYATIEFRNTSTGKQYYPLSPIICSLSFLIGFGVIVICIWILSKFHTLRRKTSSKDQEKKFLLLEKKYEGIAVLFEEFDNSSLITQSAFLIFIIKAIIESLIVGFFFEYPLFQAILLLLLTFSLLAYNIIKRPFNSKISLAQQLVLVLSLFICNILLNVMAGTDLSTQNFQTVRERTSQGIFWILIMFQFIPLVFFGIGLIESAWRFYKWLSSVKKSKKMNVKKAHRLAKEPDHSSFSSLDQSQTQLVDMKNPPKIDLEKTIINDHKDFAKHIENAKNETNIETRLSERKKKKHCETASESQQIEMNCKEKVKTNKSELI